MDSISILQRLTLALSIGLLIGIERGWQERAGKDGSRAAGVRTYALIGLLGGVCAALETLAGDALLAASFVALTAGLAVFEWREASAAGSASATGLIAGLVTFALGAYAEMGSMAAAAAAGIGTTIVLAERQVLHDFVARLSWRELRAALLLLAMTFVLLPVLPDRTVDPWQALNPRQLWLMMVVIAAISYVGYIGVRLAGERVGLIFAAAAGGLVSSTAVTLAYARLSKSHPQSALALGAGITAAWIISLLRMSVIAIALAPSLLWPLAKTMGPPAAVLALFAAAAYWRSGRSDEQSPLKLNDPFELGEVLKFGLLLAGVGLASKLLGPSGRLGLMPLAALSGTVDVDPITLSAARMAGTAITTAASAQLILVAAAANLGCKSVVALVMGSRNLGLNMLSAGAAAAAAAAAVFVFGP
jgi:uncharacterized membrane protein (DUF4010 family)